MIRRMIHTYRLRRIAALLALGGVLAAGTGCVRSYQMEVQQGNVISAEQIEKINPGVSRDEVRFILGTPLIEDPFHAQRWDYFYSLDPGKGQPLAQHRLSIWFESDRVTRTHVEGAGLPGAIEPDLEEAGPGFFSRLWDKVTPGEN